MEMERPSASYIVDVSYVHEMSMMLFVFLGLTLLDVATISKDT